MSSRITELSILFTASLLLFASCVNSGKKADEPFFQMRGVILSWDDIKNPEVIDWIELMKKNGLNTISVCGHEYDDEVCIQTEMHRCRT